MKVVRSIEKLKNARSKMEGSLGFVPTMGALHEGHKVLIEEAAKKNDNVAVSIFVNPAQFGPGEDFKTYPRDEDADLAFCEKAGVDLVFLPSEKQLYVEPRRVFIKVGRLADCLCGESREGHFNGVVEVLVRLFNLVSPDSAFFGEKDYQQLLIVKSMVEDFHYFLDIIAVPTVREKNGLAMSSRNRKLSFEERNAAASLYHEFKMVREKAETARFDRRALPVEFIEKEVAEKLNSKHPEIKIDYIEIRNEDTLEKNRFIVNNSRIFGAIYISGTRLIDNLHIGN
ncbi:MAG: pantoate--beta-alanine ligase [bacterium]